MKLRSAIQAIERRGILLVYPIDNRKLPPSLWSEFYPRSEMRWEWDDAGDNRVADLWHLREELSRSGKVVYAKWYRGRATFFSRQAFSAMLAVIGSSKDSHHGHGQSLGLTHEARQILEVLQFDSPLSTKQIKKATDLRGKACESTYGRALKQLWEKLLIVGYGEFDDGAFPSLGIGATRGLFEDLWSKSRELSSKEGREILHACLSPDSLFIKQLEKQLSRKGDRKAAPHQAASFSSNDII